MGAISERPRTMWELYQYLPEGVPVQLINNLLIMSPAPKDCHQQLVVDISYELTYFIKSKGLGKIRIAPSDVFLNKENIYQPDIYFVATQNVTGFEEDGFHGAPDLVIEILSPGSEKYDKNEKLKVYEASGVKEYWLVNPENNKATGYFNTNGSFQLISEDLNKISCKLLDTIFNF